MIIKQSNAHMHDMIPSTARQKFPPVHFHVVNSGKLFIAAETIGILEYLLHRLNDCSRKNQNQGHQDFPSTMAPFFRSCAGLGDGKFSLPYQEREGKDSVYDASR